ncbi:TIGR03986 family CRISPR-associated RAMP protein [Streptomyces sp. AC558_RSS880]|uniref:TIGR03986 family type III CRISPR-associated RAMP protein n=1 Tax=Streptomyces sp. AC558_RSS880 TaxID=2823687 RepID=UPI001C23DE7E|nr:TIGR03986 family CRISPR-associated RAMP protein [Streptomyces sp. AC558_RSS880]
MHVTADEFVNPYTFVQVPKERPVGWRAAPAGHDRLGLGRLGGVLTVEFTARGPLLLRNVYGDEQEGVFPTRRVPGFGEPVPYLPGSALAGAVRSLHETMAGGCLRVFDGDFRPGYRDQVKQQDPRMRLAFVEKVDERGAPAVVRLCDEAVWIESVALHKVLGGPAGLYSGARVTVIGKPEAEMKRRLIKEPADVKAGDESVLLVTDARTRREVRKNSDGQGPRKLRGRYYCASGKLQPDSLKVELSDKVWQSYLDAVDGTNDMREFRRKPTTAKGREAQLPVLHPNDRGERLLGYRDPARRELYEGQVVWVDAERSGDTVVLKKIALSAIWRHAGGTAKARDRVPPEALACSDPQRLCPSCRLFGSVDAEGEDGRGGARQRAYRGHVRFGDAVPSGSVPALAEHWLPPMGSPKPGAGQFYLKRNDGLENKTVTEQQGDPLREWGCPDPRADGAGTRQLRGRKHYWLTSVSGERPYFRARSGNPEVFHDLYGPDNQMLSKGQAVAAGSRFTARVFFENLDEAELGGLLCALNPGLLLHPFDDEQGERPEYGLAVGGGRPLGFGSCTTEITRVELDTAAGRYLGADAPVPDPRSAVAAFRKAADKALRDVWKRELTKVLRLDWSPADRVWYPPAGRIPPTGRPFKPEVLMPSFTFWKETSGGRAKDANFPYRQLPAAAHQEPGMEVIVQKEKDGDRG